MFSLLPEVPLAHQRACRAQELLQRHLVAVLGGQAATRAPMQTFGKRGRPEGRRPAPDDFLARGQRVGWHRAKSRVAGFRQLVCYVWRKDSMVCAQHQGYLCQVRIRTLEGFVGKVCVCGGGDGG